MKLIKSKVEILDKINGDEVITKLARVARTCYKSEDASTLEKDKRLVENLIKSGHEAMIEFFDVTVKFTCDKGTSHQIVRHRMASYAQESSRYCDYSKDKFGNELTFIIPSWIDLPEGEYMWEDQNPLLTAGLSIEEAGYDDSSDLWIKDSNGNGYLEYKRHYNGWMETEAFMHALQVAESDYMSLLKLGWKAQQARMVLPMSIKTELNMKANLREWRCFFKLRCDTAAHPDMRKLALDLLEQMHSLIPVVFDDIYEKYGIGTKNEQEEKV